jgi:hypothetical protein
MSDRIGTIENGRSHVIKYTGKANTYTQLYMQFEFAV